MAVACYVVVFTLTIGLVMAAPSHGNKGQQKKAENIQRLADRLGNKTLSRLQEFLAKLQALEDLFAGTETTIMPSAATTQAAVDETTQAAVDETTQAAVDETTHVAVDETTQAAVDETTQAAVDETTPAAVEIRGVRKSKVRFAESPVSPRPKGHADKRVKNLAALTKLAQKLAEASEQVPDLPPAFSNLALDLLAWLQSQSTQTATTEAAVTEGAPAKRGLDSARPHGLARQLLQIRKFIVKRLDGLPAGELQNTLLDLLQAVDAALASLETAAGSTSPDSTEATELGLNPSTTPNPPEQN